jgi:hypothetical protein
MKILILLPVMLASTACAFSTASLSSRSGLSTRTKLNMLFTPVEEAIADAQRICAMDPASPECRVAWDIVEELEAADSHRGGIPVPAAPADFLSLVEGFDILVERIDHKMDRLKATTESLAQLGVTDAAITSLYDRAQDMKQALMDARNTLRQY